MDTLGGLLRFPLEQIPFLLLVLIIAFTLHEFAHAFAADKFGDPTPRSMGRVTLNPRVHLDVLGTILIFIAGFGWAKPVLVNRRYFKKPRLMSLIVSFVGPLANLLIAFAGLLLFYSLVYFGVFQGVSHGAAEALTIFFTLLVRLNLLLFVFNLIPLPPLDGYRIVQEFLPLGARLAVQRYEHWAIFVFLLLVFIDPLYRVTLGPVFSLIDPLFGVLDGAVRSLFGGAFA